MALTDVQLRNAKPAARPYKLTDGGGLFVLVTPAANREGGKYWRLKYRFAGKEKLLAIGVYPTIGAAEARAQRDKAKQALREGRDPQAIKQELKRAAAIAANTTFESIAREWLKPENRGGKQWTPAHAIRVRESLEDDVFGELGARPIAEITAPQLLTVLRRIQARGALETAQRVLQRSRSVFGFAMAHGICPRNPAADAELHKLLKAPERKNRASLGAADLPEFLRKVDAYVDDGGTLLTKLALKLQVLTWVRPGELRAGEWTEFDFDAAQWNIPAARMKMREPHVVPLSRQSLAVLEQLRPLTGSGRYLFPNDHNPTKCMSENTVLFSLYRMGYRSKATAHGFRATASTILNGQRYKRGKDLVRRWNSDAIERQLAHRERNDVRGAYHHTEYLDERTEMMQAWADYLDTAHTIGKVTPIRKEVSHAR
ncbi:MAG TPA: integrase arm-type DNA-binding domain-containing protein [Burkholderiales bacterium]